MFSYTSKRTLSVPTNVGDLSSSLTGRLDSTKASVEEGFNSATAYVVNPFKNWYAGKQDEKNGLAPVTEEEVNDYRKIGLFNLNSIKGETPTQLYFRAEAQLAQQIRHQSINQNYPITNTIGMLAPAVVDPANLVPFGRALRVSPLSQLNKVNIAIAQGDKYAAAMHSVKGYVAEALVSNTAVAPFHYANMHYQGVDYDASDVALDIAVGTGVGAGFFGPIAAYRNFRRAGVNLNKRQMFEDMNQFFQTGDYTKAANVLYEGSPEFRKKIKKIGEFTELVNTSIQTDGVIDFTNLNAGQIKTLRGVVDYFHGEGLQASLTNALSKQLVTELEADPDVSINQFAYNQRTRYADILVAIQDRDISRLSEVDQEIARSVIDASPGVTIDALPEATIDTADGMLPAITKSPIRFDTDNLGSLAEAHKRAGNILRIIKENKATSVQDLVDRGIINEQQKTAALTAFNKAYEKAYAREIGVANSVINNIFGRQFNFDKMPKEKRGVSISGKPTIGQAAASADLIMLNRAEVVLGMGKSPFGLMLHEATHVIKAQMPEMYAELESAIGRHPDFQAEIRKYKAHYSADLIDAEIPSVTLEWAITQPAFWTELNKANKTLFKQFSEAIVEILKRAKELFSKSKLNTEFLNDVDNLLVDMTPAEFAAQLAAIINSGRGKNLPFDQILNATQSVNSNIRNLVYSESIDVGTEPKTKTGGVYSGIKDFIFSDSIDANTGPRTEVNRVLEDYKPESTVTGQNAKLREHRRQTFNRLAATTLPNVRGENVQRFVETLTNYIDELAEEVDPDAQEFISFDEYKARIREFTSEIIDEDLTREDILSSADYTELYDNLRLYSMSLVNDKSLLRNNDLYRKVIRGTKDLEQASAQYRSTKNSIVKEYYENKAQAVVGNAMKRAAVKSRLRNFKTDAQRLAYLRTLLDGQERKNMPRIAGLENEMTANSQNAAVPILDVLYKHGLDELFMPDNSFGVFRADRKDPKWHMFGKSRKDRSKAFHDELHKALLARKLPEAWGEVPALKEMFDVLMATEVRLLDELNAAGLDIKMLSDFGGVSQKWDGNIIHTMGYQKFKARMLEVMDLEATSDTHAGVLFIDGKEEVFTVDAFLKQWYDTLDPNRKIDSDVQVFDLEESFGGRMVRIKPEHATDVMLEFSGYDNIGYLMLQQIQRRSALATMASFAGTKPNEMLTGLLEGLSTGRGVNAFNAKSYKATVDSLTGILENPVDSTLATFENKFKQLSNILFLSGSGISSLTDIPMVASTLEVMGVRFGETNKLFLEAYGDAMKRRFGDDPDGMRDFLLGQGAGFDAINNQVIRRLSDTTTNVGKMDKLHNLLFKINGLNALTTAHQELFVDVLTQGIAREFGKPTMSSQLRANLLNFGFEAGDIDKLRKSVTKSPDGTFRLVPTGVKDAALAKKYRQYITKYMRQAVFMPDAGTNAQMTLGFRKGTFEGTLARIATQYQPFMAGMTKLLYRRFMNGDFGKGDAAMAYKVAHLVSYIGGALAFGYIATVLKDLARGEKPMSLLNMRPYQWSRVVQQSGMLGVLEMPLDIKDYGVMEALSPLPSTIFGLGVDLSSGDAKGALDNAQALTGENIYGPPQWLHGMIGEVMTEYLNEIQGDMLKDLDDMSYAELKSSVDREAKAGNIHIGYANGKPVQIVTKNKETKALVNEFKERINQK